MASWLNKADLVHLLLKYGANPHLKNNVRHLYNLQQYAISNKLFQRMTTNIFFKNVKQQKKETALSTAKMMRNRQVVNILENPPPVVSRDSSSGDVQYPPVMTGTVQ